MELQLITTGTPAYPQSPLSPFCSPALSSHLRSQITRKSTKGRVKKPIIISPSALSGFDHLQELELRYATVSKLERDLVLDPCVFPNLQSLDIEFCGASVATMFSMMRLPCLKIAKLSAQNKEGSTVQFLKAHGPSLEVLVLESIRPTFRWCRPLLELCCNLKRLQLWSPYRAPIYMNLVPLESKHTSLEVLSVQFDAFRNNAVSDEPESYLIPRWESTEDSSSSSVMYSEPESYHISDDPPSSEAHEPFAIPRFHVDTPSLREPDDTRHGLYSASTIDLDSRSSFFAAYDTDSHVHSGMSNSSLPIAQVRTRSALSVSGNSRAFTIDDDLESILSLIPDDEELADEGDIDCDASWDAFIESFPFQDLPALRTLHLISVDWHDVSNNGLDERLAWSNRIDRLQARLQDMQIDKDHIQVVDRLGIPWTTGENRVSDAS